MKKSKEQTRQEVLDKIRKILAKDERFKGAEIKISFTDKNK